MHLPGGLLRTRWVSGGRCGSSGSSRSSRTSVFLVAQWEPQAGCTPQWPSMGDPPPGQGAFGVLLSPSPNASPPTVRAASSRFSVSRVLARPPRGLLPRPGLRDFFILDALQYPGDPMLRRFLPWSFREPGSPSRRRPSDPVSRARSCSFGFGGSGRLRVGSAPWPFWGTAVPCQARLSTSSTISG